MHVQWNGISVFCHLVTLNEPGNIMVTPETEMNSVKIQFKHFAFQL